MACMPLLLGFTEALAHCRIVVDAKLKNYRMPSSDIQYHIYYHRVVRDAALRDQHVQSLPDQPEKQHHHQRNKNMRSALFGWLSLYKKFIFSKELISLHIVNLL